MRYNTIRYPVNFVVPDSRVWPELLESRVEKIDEKTIAERCVGSLNGWVIRTYYELRVRGNDVTISDVSNPNAINVVSPRDFGIRNKKYRDFILWPRADGHNPMLANYTIVQSGALAQRRTASYVPYWPQAGVIRRNGDRIGLTCVTFKGRTLNLAPEFRSDQFKAALHDLGVTFEGDDFDGLLGEQSWHDYRNVDAVLAVRNLTIRDARHKPASKLINAWLGGTPAILGPEPAFRALRRSELDYIEICTPEEALAAIKRLQADPELYGRMVENGFKRGRDFSEDMIAERWEKLINQRVGPLFERWKSTPAPLKIVKFVLMVGAEIVSRKYYRHYIRSGPRILDNRQSQPNTLEINPV